jgi:hypothetical protein
MSTFKVGDYIYRPPEKAFIYEIVKVNENDSTYTIIYRYIDKDDGIDTRNTTTEVLPFASKDFVLYDSVGDDQGVYTRQSVLNIDIPKTIAVIGLGGVGSWVALTFALSGIEKIILVDPDIIEKSNLNRTPYRIMDIGNSKVLAMTELILERRHIKIECYNNLAEDVDLSVFKDCDNIFDCRDTSVALPQEISRKVDILGGYNGMDMSIHVNPQASSIWGEGETRYTVTPSWLLPPYMIAGLIMAYTTKTPKLSGECVKNLDVKTLVNLIIGDDK